MVKKEVRPGGGERRTKGNGGTARSAAVGKSRRKPPRTSPTGSTASAALEKPAWEARLRRAPQRPWKSPQKAASDEPIGKHRLGGPAKPRRRPPRTSPTGSIVSVALQKPVEARLGRAHREAPPRRHWKTPWKAASDEPIGKHRLGVRTRHPMAGGWQRKKYGRAAGREGQKGTAALRAAPPLENPVGSRLRRAQREASPRRPCKTPWKAASDEPNGKHRLGGIGKTRGGSPPQTSPSASIASATLEKPAMFAPATRL